MKIDKSHQFQSMESNTLSPTDQTSLTQTPDSQNEVADSLEAHDGSDVFFGADDIFHLQAAGGAELKATAESFQSGDITTPESKDGFKLQDALQTYSRDLSVDLPQQFTDSISSLQKNVDAALSGDAAALEKVEATFGFVTDQTNLSNLISPTQTDGVEKQSGAAGGSDSKNSEWKDDFDWEPPDHDDNSDTPDIPDEGQDQPDFSQPTDQTNDTPYIAAQGGTDGGTQPQPADGGTNPDDGSAPDGGSKPDAGTDPADDGGGGYVEPDPDLEDLEVQRYVDPDAIFYQGSGELTETGKRTLDGGGVTDGSLPDMQDVAAPQLSAFKIPGDGVTDATPEIDDYTALTSGELRTFGPGGDIVNPDNPIEAPSGGGIPSTDPESHND